MMPLSARPSAASSASASARGLRPRPESLAGRWKSSQSAQHEPDHAKAEKGEGIDGKVLEVLGEPAAAAKPGERSFHDPALGQRLEAGCVVALDDLQPPAACPGHGFPGSVALVGAISEDDLNERKQPTGGAQDRQSPVSVLDVGRMDHGTEQEAQRVDQDVPLLALDLLARVVTAWINARPPFSALFTLWLSMIAAVGLASLPACSRAWTNRA